MTDGFIFYGSFMKALATLPDDERLKAYDAICRYALYGEEPKCDGAALGMFYMAQPQIDANRKRRENGNKGGRPVTRTDEEKESVARMKNTAEYKQWHDAVFKKYGERCAMCGATKGHLNAHHIKNVHDYPELRFDVENGIVLCNSCHSYVHKNNLTITENKPNDNLTESEGEPKEKVKVKDKVKDKDISLMPVVKEVVDYLNEKAGTKYRAYSKATADLVKARLNEKYTVDDFKTVIDNMTAKWLGDPKMESYLRPETLFNRSHFESYLNTRAKPRNKFQNFPVNEDNRDLARQLMALQ